VAWLCLFSAGCDNNLTSPTCHSTPQRVVEEISSGRYRGVTLAREAETLYALWSRPEGSFIRALSNSGDPAGAVIRWGPSCPGGMDALDGSPLVVACATSGSSAQAKAGRLLVFRLNHGERESRSYAVATLDGHGEGVSIAQYQSSYVVAWHTASEGRGEAWRSVLTPDLQTATPPVRLSSARVSAGPPEVFAHNGDLFVTWAESWLRSGRNAGHVVVQRNEEMPQTVANTRFGFPRPQLLNDSEGLIVAFRDQRRPYPQAGLYLGRINNQLRPLGDPRRSGRADGRGSPSIQRCGETLFTASPRTWAEDHIIGIGLLTPEFRPITPERQVYEDEHRFNDVTAICEGDDLLVLAAEEWTVEHPTARLITVKIGWN